MTLKITPLQEISPDKGKVNIKVKILSLWNQYYSNNNSKLAGVDMILMDEQGTKIHATINSSVVCDFDTLLKENDYKIISNFNVKRNVDATKLTIHEFKIYFYKKTNVRNCSEFICGDGFKFKSFKDLLDARIDQSYSFDVIGRLIQNKDITVLNPNNAPKHILEFQLQDVTGATISCILWNDLAKKLHQYIKNHEHSTEPIIVLIMMARLSTWNRVTQVSNCFAGSKLLINEDNQHIKAFKDMFESTNLSSSEKTKVELSSNTLVRKPEDYYSQFPLMTIDELYDLSEVCGTLQRVILMDGNTMPQAPIQASQSDSNEKALAEGVTMKNNIESHKIDLEKKPIVEHQDSKDDTVNKLTDDKDECKTSAEGRTKRKNNEAGNSDIPKKSKVDHQETKAEII
ncbi:replication protein A 70 kDa DNA-binding subunit D, partial [Tanacetum coccineum]